MNRKEFIKALNEGHTLHNRDSGVKIWYAYNDRIFLTVLPECPIFTSGDRVIESAESKYDCVLMDGNDPCILIDPSCFEILGE